MLGFSHWGSCIGHRESCFLSLLAGTTSLELARVDEKEEGDNRLAVPPPDGTCCILTHSPAALQCLQGLEWLAIFMGLLCCALLDTPARRWRASSCRSSRPTFVCMCIKENQLKQNTSLVKSNIPSQLRLFCPDTFNQSHRH